MARVRTGQRGHNAQAYNTGPLAWGRDLRGLRDRGRCPRGCRADRTVSAAPLWTGFYFGAHAGGGQSDKKFIDNFPTYDGELDAAPTLLGPLGGLQAGYNHQFNWLVIGIEGDFSWAGVREKQFSCFFFGDQICSAESQWFASVTGRIGAAVGPTFLYVKGGAAWVRDEYTDVATCSGTQRVFRAGIYAIATASMSGRKRAMVGRSARHRIPHQPELVAQGRIQPYGFRQEVGLARRRGG